MEDVERRSGDLLLVLRLNLSDHDMRTDFSELTVNARDILNARTLQVCLGVHAAGSVRFNELRRLIGPISTRTLADRLSFLQRRALVIRDLFDDAPPRVEYRLSPTGQRFAAVLYAALAGLVTRRDEDSRRALHSPDFSWEGGQGPRPEDRVVPAVAAFRP